MNEREAGFSTPRFFSLWWCSSSIFAFTPWILLSLYSSLILIFSQAKVDVTLKFCWKNSGKAAWLILDVLSVWSHVPLTVHFVQLLTSMKQQKKNKRQDDQKMTTWVEEARHALNILCFSHFLSFLSPVSWWFTVESFFFSSPLFILQSLIFYFLIKTWLFFSFLEDLNRSLRTDRGRQVLSCLCDWLSLSNEDIKRRHCRGKEERKASVLQKAV